MLQGEIVFTHGYRITVRERLSFDAGSVQIEFYGYELWRDMEKIAWYDAQPHPEDVTLSSTFPHHKHLPPDIRYHRIPASNMSFSQPNISALIQEIERCIASTA